MSVAWQKMRPVGAFSKSHSSSQYFWVLVVSLVVVVLAIPTEAFVVPGNNGGKQILLATSSTAIRQSSTEQPETSFGSLLLTFDLDDTLFPIQQVVDAANDAQIKAMHSLGYTERTSMEQCMIQTRAIRQTLTAPITYTDLRKGAIRAELERLQEAHKPNDDNSSSMSLQEQVDHCFDDWLQARHDAAEDHLFPETIPALKDIQAHFSSSFDSVCLGGITNGRGNPLDMTSTLAPYFMFCVSGEDDDVFPHRKPHVEIYEAALERWRSLDIHSDDNTDGLPSKRPDLWVHVGDCLANDVGASHEAGARAIWVAQPEEEGDQPSWSTATEKDRKERALLMEAARSKMSGQVTNLSELLNVIEDLLSEERI